ncbi:MULTISPECIES: B12-binding domain-containing radical SAM protein [Anaerococcus]|uniref:B12-binding domain-containing radical SAM protein n=1 Tax=Anaerococcus TaxID=165779 RepID=UPI0024312E9E|nr:MULTISPECIES: radical SAM protein [Anaerococcus]MDD7767092.1 radical SAM protein [Anaerococcus vaginalis]MDY6127369.1 radical SAM protein [Anaerococcus sp.]
MYDIIFVGEVAVYNDQNMPYLGQELLNQILKNNGYNSLVINVYEYYKENNIKEFYKDDTIIKLASYIKSLKPKIVSFYTVCETFPLTSYLAETLSNLNKNIKIIFAGPHSSLLGKEILKRFPYIDIVAYSEGEYVVEKIVDYLNYDKDKIENIEGIYYRCGTDIRKTSPPRLVKSAKLHKYFVKEINQNINSDSYLTLEGGRGCPFNCSFCTTSLYWQRKARLKPIKDLISEINYYIKKYNIYKFNIIHDLFTSNRTYIENFCNSLIENNIKISWSCSARIDTLDEDLIELMKKSGLSAIYIGIESGSDIIQKEINKNINLSRAITLIKHLTSIKIEVTVSLIYGFANEGEKDLSKTIDLYNQIFEYKNIFLQLHIYGPYPKTKEINKIKDDLYFNEKYYYLPYHQIKILSNNYCKKFILDNLDLTTAFYDFPTIVREKYSNLSFLNEIIMSLRVYFPIVLGTIIKNIGLLDFYLIFEDELFNIKKEVLKISEMDNDFKYKYIQVIYELINDRKFYNIVSLENKNILGIEKYIIKNLINSRHKIFVSIKSDIDLNELYNKEKFIEKSGIYIVYGSLLNFNFSYAKNKSEYNQRKNVLLKAGYKSSEVSL